MVELLKPSEVASELRVSVGTVYGWLNGGRVLPGIRMGGQWRVSRRDLDALAAGAIPAVLDSDESPVVAPSPLAKPPGQPHPLSGWETGP